MQHRTLGKTGWQVSVLGFGASPLGGVFGTIDESDAIRAVHQAFDGGVNFVDVAPYYGITKAETVLGKALAQVSRDRFYLSTKVGRYGNDEFDFSADRVVRSVDESLGRLNISHIDLIICHDIEYVDIRQVWEEAIPALRQVQRAGKVRAIGISGLPLKIYRDVIAQSDLDVILSYCHYTLQDDTLLSLIPELQAQDIGIINAAPLSMGLLSGAEPPSWHPASPELKAACARAAEHCRSRGMDLATLATQFAIANPDIATTLIGMGDTEQVTRNLAAIASPPDPTLLAEVAAILAPVHNQGWQTGRPENNDPT
jgi:L-galactose dehydrogenase